MSEAMRVIVGVDEAGRGPLAGPVMAAAVLLGAVRIGGLADSKKLGAARRAVLAATITEECVACHVAAASVEEINGLNILEATFAAMQRAVAGIVIVPDEVLVDGNRLPGFPYPSRAVVGGDGKVPEIMAASILAKHARDEVMRELDSECPGYGFAKHKGYPTPEHLAKLTELGPSRHHRTKFGPVARLLAQAGTDLAE